MLEIPKIEIEVDNKVYTVYQLEEIIHMNETNEELDNQCYMTNVIEGFGEDLYVVQEVEEEEHAVQLHFVYKVGELGLFMSLEDEESIDIANEVIFLAVEENTNY